MKNFLTSLLFNLLVIAIIMSVMFYATGVAGALFLGAALFLYTLTPDTAPQGVVRNEVLKRLFTSDLKSMLFPNNSFFSGAQKDAAAVDTEVVEIPQDENGATEVLVNPKNFPLDLTTEEDSKKTYGADFLVTKPTVIFWNNQLLVSYDKRSAKLRKHRNSLETDLANRILYGWGATEAAYIRQTTGGTSRPSVIGVGTRKRAIQEDWIWAMTMFNKLNIPMDRRRVVVDPFFYEDLLLVKKDWAAGTEKSNQIAEDGALFKAFTFSVFMRSITNRYTEAATPVKKAIGAAAADTDNSGAVFYHPDFVRYIESEIKVNMDATDRPDLAGGRSMNVSMRGGGTTSYTSELGVLALVEDN